MEKCQLQLIILISLHYVVCYVIVGLDIILNQFLARYYKVLFHSTTPRTEPRT